MKISIVTPTRNRAQLVVQAVESGALSRVEPLSDLVWEHIILDDGSTDETATLLSGNKFPITYIRSDQSAGISAAKNRAIAEASGEWILVLDDDDLLLQRTLFNFATAIAQYPSAQWFIADFLKIDEKRVYQPGEDYFGWTFTLPEEMLSSIWKGEHFIQANVLMHKDLFLSVGKFDDDPAFMRLGGEDLDLYIRFLRAGHMPVVVPFLSHLHRVHSGNFSKEITHDRHLETISWLKAKYKEK